VTLRSRCARHAHHHNRLTPFPVSLLHAQQTYSFPPPRCCCASLMFLACLKASRCCCQLFPCRVPLAVFTSRDPSLQHCCVTCASLARNFQLFILLLSRPPPPSWRNTICRWDAFPKFGKMSLFSRAGYEPLSSPRPKPSLWFYRPTIRREYPFVPFFLPWFLCRFCEPYMISRLPPSAGVTSHPLHTHPAFRSFFPHGSF